MTQKQKIESLKRRINQIGKKGKANLANVAELKIKFDAMGIRFCEKCGRSGELTFAHRTTRQHISTKEEMQAVVRICLECHIRIEGKPNMTEIVDGIIANRMDLSFVSA